MLIPRFIQKQLKIGQSSIILHKLVIIYAFQMLKD